MFKRLTLCLLIVFTIFQQNLAQSDCPMTPRLVVGEMAQVSAGQSNNVRETASRDGTRLGVISAGSIVEVVEGPVCVDALQWWHVRYHNLDGWTVEGSDGDYWLEPVAPLEPVEYTRQIAFARMGRGFEGIYWVNPDDLVVESLAGAGNIGHIGAISWFPDGQSLAYAYYGFGGEGTSGRLAIRSLAPQDHTVMSGMVLWRLFGVSPDGQKIAYNSEGVSVLDLQSGQSELIRDTEGFAFIDWSPNGEQIVVQTYDPPRITQIVAVDGAADPQPITVFDELDLSILELDWSPDGKYLAMNVIADVNTFPLVVYEIATERWVMLTDENLSISEPDWSPDGSEIAFRARTTTSVESSIYIINLFDNSIQRLTEGGEDYQPKWRPVPGITPINIAVLFEGLWEASR